MKKAFKIGIFEFESFDYFITLMVFVFSILLITSLRLITTQQATLILVFIGVWELCISYVRKHGLPKGR